MKMNKSSSLPPLPGLDKFICATIPINRGVMMLQSFCMIMASCSPYSKTSISFGLRWARENVPLM